MGWAEDDGEREQSKAARQRADATRRNERPPSAVDGLAMIFAGPWFTAGSLAGFAVFEDLVE
jgi:hypothetical protein